MENPYRKPASVPEKKTKTVRSYTITKHAVDSTFQEPPIPENVTDAHRYYGWQLTKLLPGSNQDIIAVWHININVEE